VLAPAPRVAASSWSPQRVASAAAIAAASAADGRDAEAPPPAVRPRLGPADAAPRTLVAPPGRLGVVFGTHDDGLRACVIELRPDLRYCFGSARKTNDT